jgi:hypothetical protein
LSAGIWHEDGVVSLRAWLYDRIVAIPEALVRYRQHDSNLVNRVPKMLTTLEGRRRAEEDTRIHSRRCRETLSSYMPDLERAVSRGWVSEAMCQEFKSGLNGQATFHRIVEEWWQVHWGARVARFLSLLMQRRWDEARWCGPRLLPFSIFLRMGAFWTQQTARLRGRSRDSQILTLLSCLLTVAN